MSTTYNTHDLEWIRSRPIDNKPRIKWQKKGATVVDEFWPRTTDTRMGSKKLEFLDKLRENPVSCQPAVVGSDPFANLFNIKLGATG